MSEALCRFPEVTFPLVQPLRLPLVIGMPWLCMSESKSQALRLSECKEALRACPFTRGDTPFCVALTFDICEISGVEDVEDCSGLSKSEAFVGGEEPRGEGL